jgi:antitoxin YefM
MISGEVLGVKAIKPVDLRNNQKELLDLAYGGEILLVARPAKKNVVVISEDEFNRREKALRNAEYLAMLEQSIQEVENGDIVEYSLEELKILGDGDKQP